MNTESVAHDFRSAILSKGHSDLPTRIKKLKSLKDAVLANELKINEALKKDLGKSSFESYAAEIGLILEELNYTLKHIKDWCEVKKVKTPLTLLPGKSAIYPEPYGVVLIISPWNYPFQLCISPLIGAIAAGNKVVVKPSEFTPETSAVTRMIIESVFDKEEVLVVEGGVDKTQSLLKQKFDYIFFTGSTQVGKIVMKAAAEHLTPVTLELGGKSPCFIEASANIDISAKRCAWGKFLNAGQTCVAPDYVLIPRKLQDEFIQRLNFHIKKFYGEKPEASDDFPRIVNENHFDRLISLIDSKKLAIGGGSNKAHKFIEPTIMKDVTWEDKIMQDEIFGPILPIIPYDDESEALTKILSRPKPLAFYVFSENDEEKQKIISKMSFGGACINDTIVHLTNPNLPFGGVGMSGTGSYHGKKSFETFTHYKSVFEQRTKVDIPVRYPPYAGKLKWLKFFVG
jgi:aldehyde dehydrogenase (NAD+)